MFTPIATQVLQRLPRLLPLACRAVGSVVIVGFSSLIAVSSARAKWLPQMERCVFERTYPFAACKEAPLT